MAGRQATIFGERGVGQAGGLSDALDCNRDADVVQLHFHLDAGLVVVAPGQQ
ncbi:MAG: hypothetical protein M3Q88_01235 [Pseudomonadota bacterium]|nr:hypothetical protein [Pseudomonadota bacterium]